MNVSPAQRLVTYLREFPLARPAVTPKPARADAPPAAAVERPAVAERRQPLAQPAAASSPPGPLPSPPANPRLPRGTLLNIVT